MAKNHISQQDPTAGNNTDIGGISIDEGAMAMSSINNAFREQSSQLADFYDDIGGTGTVGGTADAITLTSQMPALATGNLIRFVAGANNTGAVTINVNGLGAKAIRKISSGADVALAANDIRDAEYQLIIYDAAANSAAGAWILIASGGMSPDVYDPNGVGADAFDMDNMVEGTDTKVMTAAERSAISGLASTYQPLDSDLTAIAALSTTSYGRALLALADQAALQAAVNVEDNADVTDETNVVSALSGATLTAATVATGDKVLVQDADDTDNLKTVTAQSIADLGGGASVLLAKKTASASSSLDFTEFDNSTYEYYVFVLTDIYPASDDSFQLRTDANGGASYDSGTNNYESIANTLETNPATVAGHRATSTGLILSANLDVESAGTRGVSGTVKIIGAGNSGEQTAVHFNLSYIEDSAGNAVLINGAGWRQTDAITDAVRFMFSSANIASGTIAMYGMVKS